MPADKLVDTNGAGDAFVGGFLSQLVRRHSQLPRGLVGQLRPRCGAPRPALLPLTPPALAAHAGVRQVCG